MNISASRFQTLETPFYYYDLDLLQQTIETAKACAAPGGYHVHYAIKANYNEPILKVIREAGFGADCVSGNEVLKAVEAGFDRNSIVFAGVGKSDREIRQALGEQIFGFNCESIQELSVINQLAVNDETTANVSLRINPNVDAGTHRNITTGLEENKFGINLWELDEVLELIDKLTGLRLIGLHFHIGSQVTDLSRFTELCQRVNEVNRLFKERGYDLEHINVGGGLGINYEDPLHHLIPDFKSYFGIFQQHLEVQPNQEVHFELGRALVGQCGLLISRVLYEKVGRARTFLILDAGMTELMRPALYQAQHVIRNISSEATESRTYDVVGPICETTDAFSRGIELPVSSRGDLMAIYSAGAYGEVLKNRYNLRSEVGAIYSSELH